MKAPMQCISRTASETLSRQGYHLVSHGAVKPCLWLNRSLRGGDQCYKHHFYGIESHACVQMTPVLHCNHQCLHCWRPIDDPIALPQDWIEPRELLDKVLNEQQRLISGYGGSPVVDRGRLIKARSPAHVAISLMGEPTFYPYLGELIEEIRRRSMTSFLVSNGTNPGALEGLQPTQLYISINAPNEELYMKISQPRSSFYDRIMQSLAVMEGCGARTVLRLTLASGLNITDPDGYARQIEIANPDFVEVKAYMHLGRSRLRLGREAMPDHEQVAGFARIISEASGIPLVAQVPLSRVVLLSRSEKSRRIEQP